MDTDVVVVGGGSAGLQVALTLSRMRFDVAVVDAGRPSNAPAHAIGGLLGAHDVAPAQFLADRPGSSWQELPSVRLIHGEASSVEAGHTVTLSRRDGAAVHAPSCSPPERTTPYPTCPGWPSSGGRPWSTARSATGWEARDKRIGLLSAGDEHAGHLVPMLSRLLRRPRGLRHRRGPARRGRGAASCRPARRHRGPVRRPVRRRPALPRDSAFAHLQLERAEANLVAIDSFGRTSAAGIYAAGDLVTVAPAVVQALATGQRAAVGVTRDLAG